MAMQVFTVGQVLAAADVNEYLVNTRYAAKAADTTRASTTTLTADPDLTLPVDANKSYRLECMIIANSNATANFKLNFTRPSGMNAFGTALGQGLGGFGSGIPYDAQSGLDITSNIPTFAGNAITDFAVQISAVIVSSSTAGSLTLQWAQNTSNAGNTIVRQGSWMLLRRVS